MKKLLALILFILVSCEYEPAGSNFVEVSQYVEPIILDIELIPDGDTLTLISNTDLEIEYTFNSPNKTYLGAEVLLDDSENPIRLSSPDYEFTIEGMDQGERKAEMNIFYSTETGSLADKLRAEVLVITKSFVIKYIDPEEINKNIIAYRKDGRLEFSWESLDSPEYFFYLSKKEDGDFSYGSKTIAWTKANNKVIQDTNYVGEEAYYRLRLKIGSNNIYYNTYKKEEESINLNYSMTDTTLTLTWGETPYYNNFGYYRISGDKYDVTPNDIYASIEDYSDTTYTYRNFYKGAEHYFRLSLSPKSSFWYEYNIDTTIYVHNCDQPLDKFLSGCSYNGIGVFQKFTTNYSDYSIVDLNTNTELVSFNNMHRFFVISLNGKYVVIKKDNSTLIVVDTDDPSNYKTITAAEISNGVDTEFTFNRGKIDISNDGILALANRFEPIYFYDTKIKQLKFYFPLFKDYSDYKLSKDGTYLFCSNDKTGLMEILSVLEDRVELLKVTGIFNPSSSGFEPDPLDNESFYTRDWDELIKYSVDPTLKTSSLFGKNRVYEIDHLNQECLYYRRYDDGYYQVTRVSMETEEIIESYFVGELGTYFNKTIYTSNCKVDL